ncbi:nucleoside deaminase [Larkinella sp. VNQ87]|uniref:nucleoside deaminase n=1 Tax=Larkinella sp. VNQ87 TaxID=3400921 RepID=UPI003C0B7C1D
MMQQDAYFLREAIQLAKEGIRAGQGGPFGALVVKDGRIVGRGCNQVTSTNDPTAHAEVVAIRDACQNLNTFQLAGCTIYTSCEPCPMCLGAIYWSRPERIVYGCLHSDAAQAGFDDHFIYQELNKPREARSIPMHQHLRDEAWTVFAEWIQKTDKTTY